MDRDKEEVRRILDVLHTLTRMLDISNREIERRLGVAPSTLTRFFNGQVEAKLEMVLGIARVVGFDYGELFDFLYPERPEPGSGTPPARKVRSMLEGLQPSRPRSAAPEEQPPARGRRKKGGAGKEDPDLEQVVRKIMEDLAAERGARKAAEGE